MKSPRTDRPLAVRMVDGDYELNKSFSSREMPTKADLEPCCGLLRRSGLGFGDLTHGISFL